MTIRNPGFTPLEQLLPYLPLVPYLLGNQHLDQVRREIRGVGFEVAEVDASGVRDERDLMTILGSALNFPDYYRPNWDAFDDCIGDMMREDSAPIALLVIDADRLLAESPYDFVRGVHMLYRVVDSVAHDPGRFRLEVLFFGQWKGQHEKQMGMR